MQFPKCTLNVNNDKKEQNKITNKIKIKEKKGK